MLVWWRAALAAEEGLAEGSITLLMAGVGLLKTNQFCAGIKGGLWERCGLGCPRFKAIRVGWERLSGADGSLVAPFLAGAVEGPGGGSAVGSCPSS